MGVVFQPVHERFELVQVEVRDLLETVAGVDPGSEPALGQLRGGWCFADGGQDGLGVTGLGLAVVVGVPGPVGDGQSVDDG